MLSTKRNEYNESYDTPKGEYINYFGRVAEVIDSNKTHVLVQFIDTGYKLCTKKPVRVIAI